MIKGRISAMQHFSSGDGPGIRTTVFFQGCNLSCRWCHNPETIPCRPVLLFYGDLCQKGACGLPCVRVCDRGARGIHIGLPETDPALCESCGSCARACPAGALTLSGREISLGEVMGFILEDGEYYTASGGGVTLSGGEPLLQPDFAAKIAQSCQSEGINVILDTAGNVDYSVLKGVARFCDGVYYDLKGKNLEDYRAFTGGSFKLATENLKKLILDGFDTTVRIPVIPGYNDSEDYMRALSDIVLAAGAKKIHLLPFHRLGSGKYRALKTEYPYAGAPPISDETLRRLAGAFTAETEVILNERK